MTGPGTALTLRLPGWVDEYARGLPRRLPDAEARMRVAVELSDMNRRRGTGGPFGALVVSRAAGDVIALGVNRVESERCSAAHAEIVALSLAQQRLETWDLAATGHGELELVTSCEPCAMCLGAVPWSGVKAVVCGADKAAAEAAGFDEGERPADWAGVLEKRSIAVTTGILADEAAAVLAAYAEQGGRIYNPGGGEGSRP